MFKGHPKGLFILSLANMGERFGYYTMLAIFVLFIQAKFGFTSSQTSDIFGIFLAAVYFLPLFGGIIADKWLGYGKTIVIGITVMFIGYFLLAIPTGTDLAAKLAMFGSLTLIALGTGLFKGNVQALVGNLYDDPRYSSKRDLAFSIFYMCINIGAFFAPSAATAVTNFFLSRDGLTYKAQIPSLAHQLLDGTITAEGTVQLTDLAASQGYVAGENIQSLNEFGQLYIEKLSGAYNWGFGVACLSLIVSMAIFVAFRKTYKAADVTAAQQAKAEKEGHSETHVVELTKSQVKERITALCLVFAVVIFFWMSFHQNGLTMTFFARDYTEKAVDGASRLWFSLPAMIFIIVAFYGLLNVFQSKEKRSKTIAAIVAVAGIACVVAYYFIALGKGVMEIGPEIFQQFNPFFIIVLTTVILAFFTKLASKGKEPSAPRKIGIGMLVAAIGFTVLMVGSFGLAAPSTLAGTGGVSETLVSSNWLIGTYFTLTIAELFLSPMGLSFVSRVAPPKYKGLMQGGWLAATAIGNYLVAIIGKLWDHLQLWQLWAVLVVCCLISAIFIFSIMKRLERVTANA